MDKLMLQDFTYSPSSVILAAHIHVVPSDIHVGCVCDKRATSARHAINKLCKQSQKLQLSLETYRFIPNKPQNPKGFNNVRTPHLMPMRAMMPN
ncbi:hypothetical protein B5X24_HaOG202332 [Helicoverpa armigera]|uniref:Uncharacterized protein n=1 Tax=Helicoverpa armigera TaxID=29058 RepID=A0A2W1BZH2_HELAM|nr:hypothetical protein B5X24_HaOG202332 [Helicoverpa armigera]